MKDMNTLEEQLRSWKPRRPLPKIEQRLFGARYFSITLPRLAGILTPTMACLMVTRGKAVAIGVTEVELVEDIVLLGLVRV